MRHSATQPREVGKPRVARIVDELHLSPHSKVVDFDAEMHMSIFDDLVDEPCVSDTEGKGLEGQHNLHLLVLCEGHVFLELRGFLRHPRAFVGALAKSTGRAVRC